MLAQTVEKLRHLASRLGDELRGELDTLGEDDERVAEELFEEELDHLLREDEGFHQVADALMEEIEKRFDLLPPGDVEKTRQSWPLKWSRVAGRTNVAHFFARSLASPATTHLYSGGC